jgi:hypothetical protein
MSDDKTRVSAEQGEHYIALPSGFVLGKYRLDSVLGQGGFGITYKAWDTSLNRAVAIKEYLPADVAIRIDGTTVTARSRNDTDHFQWGLQRFLEEARALARFEDAPSIVRVHDYLQAHGTAYMVMALIDGTPLQAIFRREAPLSETRLKAIALPLLAGLQHVHQSGFLHRDIKPSNILIRGDGQPVLIDFGAARQSLGERSHSLTSIFTPGYAPFEQYSSSGRQGPWTDIYALAATLYHGVSGKLPVSAADRIRNDPLIPAVQAAIGKYSRSFLAAIDHGLAVFEDDRPQDAMQWARMLRGEIPVPPPPRAPTAGRPIDGASPRRRAAVIVGGVALASLAIVGIGIAALPAGMLADIAPFLSSETPLERAQRLSEQARLAAEEAKRAQAVVEAEARRRAEEEARLQVEAETRARAQEETRLQAAQAQRRIEEAARARDEDARRAAEAEAARLAEEQRTRQRLIDEQVAARAAAEEARKKAEVELAEVQRQAAEAQKQAEALRQQAAAARAAAEADTQRRAEADARAKADAKAKAEADARAKAETDAKAKAEAETKRKAEAEARAKGEAEAKRKAEAEARAKAEAEARRKAEAEAKAKADQEARSRAQPAPVPLPTQIEAPPPVTSADIRAAPAADPVRQAAVTPPPPAAPAVSTPGFVYAGHWGWVIDCPNFTPGDGAHFLDSAILIEGPTFSSGFSWDGKSSGRFSGTSMNIQFTFTARNGRFYRGSLGMSVRSEREMRGGGLISGFDSAQTGLGGAASSERQCSSVMIKKR